MNVCKPLCCGSPLIIVVCVLVCLHGVAHDANGGRYENPSHNITFLTPTESRFYVSHWKRYLEKKDPADTIEVSLRKQANGIAKWLSQGIFAHKRVDFVPVTIHVVSVTPRKTSEDEKEGIMNVERIKMQNDKEFLFTWTRVIGSGTTPSIIVSAVVRTVDGETRSLRGVYQVRRVFEYNGKDWVERGSSIHSFSR